MSQDEMASQSVRGTQGAFEIHFSAGGPCADGRDVHGGHDRRAREERARFALPRSPFPDCQTYPVHRDAFTLFEIAVTAADAQLAPRVGARDALDRSDIAD